MRRMTSNIEVEIVLKLGIMNMVMKMLLATPRMSWWL
jgi:hypothetical protein